MWETTDPDGREVVLTDAGWAHVVERHPYIAVGPQDIVDTVARPHQRMPGPTQCEEWFYRRGIGPSASIRVVVHYEGGRGLIITAFPRRSIP